MSVIIRGWFSTRSLGNKKKIELIYGKSKRSEKRGCNGANSPLVTGWQRREGSPPGSGTAVLSTEGQQGLQGQTSEQPPQLAWDAARWGLYDPALG